MHYYLDLSSYSSLPKAPLCHPLWWPQYAVMLHTEKISSVYHQGGCGFYFFVHNFNNV